jgi:hypothetical protein
MAWQYAAKNKSSESHAREQSQIRAASCLKAEPHAIMGTRDSLVQYATKTQFNTHNRDPIGKNDVLWS